MAALADVYRVCGRESRTRAVRSGTPEMRDYQRSEISRPTAAAAAGEARARAGAP